MSLEVFSRAWSGRVITSPMSACISTIGQRRDGIVSARRKGTTQMTRSEANQLTDYERQYRALAAQLANIGYISAGSLARRHNRCGKPNCRCHDEPPQMHGPYLSLIHISEPTRQAEISYAVFCLK